MKQSVQHVRRQISDMLFEISYINKQGDIETLKRTVCGKEFESMIYVMRGRTKKTFIYDATTKENTNVEHQHFSFTQNTVFSQDSNMNIMDVAINRQYGRSANFDFPVTNFNNTSIHRSDANDEYLSL